MTYGFLKTACVSPRLKVADCVFNAEQIVEAAKSASQKGYPHLEDYRYLNTASLTFGVTYKFKTHQEQ